MKRLTLLPLVLAAATACSGGSAFDGTYILTADLSSYTCQDADNEESAPSAMTDRLTATVTTTAAGNVVINLSGSNLYGTVDGNAFDVSMEQQVSSDACDTYRQVSTAEFTGEFTNDLGLVGDLYSTSGTEASGCEDSDDDFDSRCTVAYTVDGIRLNNSDDREEDELNWGYSPGTGGGY